MQILLQIELGCGLKFGVEHDVKTLSDVRKMLKKADAKIAAAFKPLPELSEEKVSKVRFSVEQPKSAANAA